MAKHYVVTIKVSDSAAPEEIRVKAPNEAAALARLRQALREANIDDTRPGVVGAARDAGD